MYFFFRAVKEKNSATISGSSMHKNYELFFFYLSVMF